MPGEQNTKEEVNMKKIVCMLVLLLGFAVSASAAELKTPIIATTCGQTPGAMMLKMSAVQAKVTPAEHNNALTAKDLAGKGYKTLVVTAGTSGKGMGAAGTDIDKEIKRCEALIKEAKKLGMTVIGAQVEGMARRTDASDMKSIKAVMPLSDYILIIADSNKDGFFTKYAKELGKEMIVAKDALDLGKKLAELKK